MKQSRSLVLDSEEVGQVQAYKYHSDAYMDVWTGSKPGDSYVDRTYPSSMLCLLLSVHLQQCSDTNPINFTLSSGRILQQVPKFCLEYIRLPHLGPHPVPAHGRIEETYFHSPL